MAPDTGRLTGIGAYRPGGSLTSAELDTRFDHEEGWIEQITGIRSRLKADPDDTFVEMAAQAADKALAHAGLQPQDLDCVLFSSASSVGRAACRAAGLAHRVGADRAGGFDLNGGCAGFSYGLTLASGLIAARQARQILVVAAERLSDITDPDDCGTVMVFGDAAGAAVVSAAGRDGIGPAVWGTHGPGEPWMTGAPPKPGATRPYLHMDGTRVVRWFGSHMPQVARDALDAAGLTWDDIAAFVPHQCNGRLIDAMVRRLRPPAHVTVARSIVTDGNTSSASIPLALESLLASAAVRPGDKALLLGFGAGLTWCAQVVELP
ncbi:ketoacyl-ACP synthase III [Streptomyces sp. NPDC000134]|uniref:ketoacyl-ACP synthase III n=1 Tax=Streptomyces sp. NPDC000134 TaxID=3364536 RepID=UPI003683C805